MTPGPYEARHAPGIPTDCCDFGIISLSQGREVCRVWERDDVERLTELLNGAVPVDQWRIVVDEPVLIYVVHDNAQYESDEKVRKAVWESWCVARWIKHNKGGWMWHGLCGRITHVAPLPSPPANVNQQQPSTEK